jgi:hypothetical protein
MYDSLRLSVPTALTAVFKSLYNTAAGQEIPAAVQSESSVASMAVLLNP